MNIGKSPGVVRITWMPSCAKSHNDVWCSISNKYLCLSFTQDLARFFSQSTWQGTLEVIQGSQDHSYIAFYSNLLNCRVRITWKTYSMLQCHEELTHWQSTADSVRIYWQCNAMPQSVCIFSFEPYHYGPETLGKHKKKKKKKACWKKK